jgi:hypothetical protein
VPLLVQTAIIQTPPIGFAKNATIDAQNVLNMISLTLLAIYVEEIEKMMPVVVVMMVFTKKKYKV